MGEREEGAIETVEPTVAVELNDRIVDVEPNELVRMMSRSGVLPGGEGGSLARLILSGRVGSMRVSQYEGGEDE